MGQIPCSAERISSYYYYYYYYYYYFYFIMIMIICITQGRTAANALKLVALTVKQKCLKSPTKCFERDL